MSDPSVSPQRRPYRGVAPEQRDSARRERLVLAATEAFATTGYGSTSIDAICTAATVSKRDFYDHFANREALLIAVYDDVIAGSRRALTDALANVADGAAPVDFAHAGIRAFLAFMLDDPRRARINFVETVGASPAVERHRRETIAAFRAQIISVGEHLIAHGMLSPRDAATLRIQASVIIGAVMEAATDWLSIDEADRPALETVVTALVEIVDRAAG